MSVDFVLSTANCPVFSKLDFWLFHDAAFFNLD